MAAASSPISAASASTSPPRRCFASCPLLSRAPRRSHVPPCSPQPPSGFAAAACPALAQRSAVSRWHGAPLALLSSFFSQRLLVFWKGFLRPPPRFINKPPFYGARRPAAPRGWTAPGARLLAAPRRCDPAQGRRHRPLRGRNYGLAWSRAQPRRSTQPPVPPHAPAASPAPLHPDVPGAAASFGAPGPRVPSPRGPRGRRGAERCTILHSGADRALLTSHSHPHNGLCFSCS